MFTIVKPIWQFMILTLAFPAPASGLAATIAEPPGDVGMLYLSDGDMLAGQLRDCDVPDIIRWQMRGATQPFDFRATAVRAIYFPVPAAAPMDNSDYMVEFVDGDLLFGSLVSASPEQFEFDTAAVGQLQIARSEIRRITPADTATSAEYRGPNGLVEWQASNEQDWRDEAGRLITHVRNAKVQKKLQIPKSARIEVEIAWSDQPEFELSLSSGESDSDLQEGYRFEVWDESLVVVRVLGDRADVARVAELDKNDKRVQFQALVDQERGSMLVYALDGGQLAEIRVPPEDREHLDLAEWISLVNGRGELRLERLAVSRWGGQLPPQIDAGKPGLLQTDGTVRYGNVIGFDADTGQFTLDADDDVGEMNIAADKVACIFPSPIAKTSDDLYRVVLHDGTRISGGLTRVDDGKLYLSRVGVSAPLGFALADVRSLVAVKTVTETPRATGRVGRLELDDVRLHGELTAADASEDSTSCLVWRPRWSMTGSPLEQDVAGRIVYHDPPPPEPKPDRGERQAVRQGLIIRGGLVTRESANRRKSRPSLPKPDGTGTLHLLAGDCIPCQSITFDEAGVHFESSMVDATFVPNSSVKALELVPKWAATALTDEKRQRLLTLPRMQKPNPPTHLVASTGGDFLRARLISMNEDSLRFESRLEEKSIPRDLVACLIWLHETDAVVPQNSSDHPAPEVAPAGSGARVQAVQADGVRLTFSPQDCTGTELIGTSELLGPCRVDIGAVDLLILGATIDRAAEEQTFNSWKLTNAVEPRYTSEDADSNGSIDRAAIASGLIGKPAPDIPLEMLDDGQLRLADYKGSVVVLDFWASWCGPCMQAMPVVDKVVTDFADQGVVLVSVNLQEGRAEASGALERLKIHPAVALDVDGALAEHYQVTAIPHTVVIDKEGNVAELFVGAAPNLATELRATLKRLLTQNTSQ